MKLHLRLTPKLIVFNVCFAAFLLALVGVLASVSLRRVVETTVIADLSSTATDRQSVLSNSLSNPPTTFADLSMSPGLLTELASFATTPLDSPEAKVVHDRLVAELSPKVGEKRQFLELFLIQPETGRIIASTDPTNEGKIVADQTYF